MKEVYVVWHFWLKHVQNSKFWSLDEKWPTSWDFSHFFLLSFSFLFGCSGWPSTGLASSSSNIPRKHQRDGQTLRQKSGWNNEVTISRSSIVLLFKRFILKRKLLGTLLREQRKQSTLHLSCQRQFNWHKRLPKRVLHLTGWVNIAKDVYTNACHYKIHMLFIMWEWALRDHFSQVSSLPGWQLDHLHHFTSWSSHWYKVHS